MDTQRTSLGQRSSKSWLWVAVIAVIALGAYFFLGRTEVVAIDTDTTWPSDSAVTGDQRLVVKNGSTLTVDGDLTVDGNIACQDGKLRLIVNDNLVVNRGIECELSEEAVDSGEALSGIEVVVKGSAVFSNDATVSSNGHVQVVDDESKLLTDPAALEQLFQDVEKPAGQGIRVGPLVRGDSPAAGAIVTSDTTESVLNGIISVAHAQAGGQPCVDQNGNAVPNCQQFSGTWVMGQGGNAPPGLNVPTPKKGVRKIILNFNFGPGNDVHLTDFTLAGPDGRDGTDDKGASCSAQGKDGEDAFRLNVNAANIVINNFDLWLGNGGKGGDAETTKDCDPGRAAGGKGGKSGNFKMVASGNFEIKGAFTIHPGAGGDGGQATAHGRDGVPGCPGQKGGDAAATGGAGGDNKKELNIAGTVSGLSNITVDEVTGGAGGDAIANPGTGGNGAACGCAGGPGGKGAATGGRGGDATSKNGTAVGGDGGDADSHGGQGGTGGHCSPDGPGGPGGKGGDATSKEGAPGNGTTGTGAAGTVLHETGGNGGNGGDGCNEGAGGNGGFGKPNGKDGSPGKNLCRTSTPTSATATDLPFSPSAAPTDQTQTTSTPQPTATPSETPPESRTIRVIEYQGKYLPIDQLIIEAEQGCDGGQPHWHAAQGVVLATDGTLVPDPGPQCGYGKQSEKPVMQIQVP